MGGAAGGEVASRMAIDTFLEHLRGSAPGSGEGDRDGSWWVGRSAYAVTSKPQTRLHAAVHAANEAVHGMSTKTRQLSGMGTTLVALLHVAGPEKDRRLTPRGPRPRFVSPPTLFLANVGDSRCYRRRAGDLLQMSADHSFVEAQVLAGQITADQAATSPMRNYITRAIGPQAHVEPDIQSYRPRTGDVYVLATDGLTRELTKEEMAEVLRRTVPETEPTSTDLQAGCQELIRAANEHGGGDNITVLLLAFV